MNEKLVIHTDGGSRGNPGPGAIAAVIRDAKGKLVKELGKFIGHTTNNRAEYGAIVMALEAAAEFGARDVAIFTDSKLAANQLNGVWKVRDDEIKELFDRAKELENGRVKYVLIRRCSNPDAERADELVNETLDENI